MPQGKLDLGLMLKNPSLGGKVLFGGAGEWESFKNNMVIGGAVFVTVLLLVIALCWFTCLGNKSERFAPSGAFHGVGPSTSTFGYGLFNNDGTQSSNIANDPFGRPIKDTVTNYIAGLQTAEFRKKVRDGEAEQFDPNAVVDGRENFAEWSDADGIVLEESMVETPITGNVLGHTYGIAPPLPPSESMANTNNGIYGKIYNLNRRSSVVPAASFAGENEWQSALFQSQAKKLFRDKEEQKSMENMADVGPAAVDNVGQYISLQNVGAGEFSPNVETFKEMKRTKRSTYEHFNQMPGTVPVLPSVGVQFNNPYIGHEVAFNPYIMPADPAIANLRLPALKKKPISEGFGETSSHKIYSYPHKYNAQYSGYNQYIRPRPYTGDKVKFQSGFSKKGEVLNAIYKLSSSERQELKSISQKYTRYQLDSRMRIQGLQNKKKLAAKNNNVMFTAADGAELKNLQEFINKHGTEIDRFNNLVQKASMKLSQTQYVSPLHIPANACRVNPGLRYYGPAGKLRRLTKFVPANACNYSDFKKIGSAYTNLSDSDLLKVGDAMKK